MSRKFQKSATILSCNALCSAKRAADHSSKTIRIRLGPASAAGDSSRKAQLGLLRAAIQILKLGESNVYLVLPVGKCVLWVDVSFLHFADFQQRFQYSRWQTWKTRSRQIICTAFLMDRYSFHFNQLNQARFENILKPVAHQKKNKNCINFVLAFATFV